MMQWWADHITVIALEGNKIVPILRASSTRVTSIASRQRLRYPYALLNRFVLSLSVRFPKRSDKGRYND